MADGLTRLRNTKQFNLISKHITPPQVVCFYTSEDFYYTIKFFQKLASVDRDPRIQIVIDMGDVKFISAAAITKFFSFVAERQYSVSPSHVLVKLPRDKDILDVLRNNGFVKAVFQGGRKKLESLWDSSNFVCGNQTHVKQFISKIKTLSRRDKLPDKLGIAIKESLINVNHHAYNPQSKPHFTWWSYIYVGEDKGGQYLATVISDNGKGIPNSIRPAIPEGLNINSRNKYAHGDGHCIKRAMERSVTSTFELGRGKGSEDIKKPVQVTSKIGQHHLLVISGRGKYTYEVNELGEAVEEFMELESHYDGTLIEWFLYFEDDE